MGINIDASGPLTAGGGRKGGRVAGCARCSEEPITASMNTDTSAATFIDGRNGRGCYSADSLTGPLARSSAQWEPEGCSTHFIYLFIYKEGKQLECKTCFYRKSGT